MPVNSNAICQNWWKFSKHFGYFNSLVSKNVLFKYFIFFVFVFFSVFLLFQNIQHKTKNAKEVNIWFSHTSYASLSIIQIQLELSKFYAKGTVRPNFNSDDINFETKRALKPSHSFQLFFSTQTPPKFIIFYLNPTDTHWRSKIAWNDKQQ